MLENGGLLWGATHDRLLEGWLWDARGHLLGSGNNGYVILRLHALHVLCELFRFGLGQSLSASLVRLDGLTRLQFGFHLGTVDDIGAAFVLHVFLAVGLELRLESFLLRFELNLFGVKCSASLLVRLGTTVVIEVHHELVELLPELGVLLVPQEWAVIGV